MAISDNARGAIYMMVSMAAFTVNDTAMKALSQSIPVFQAILLRGTFAVIGLALLGYLLRSLRWPGSGRDRLAILVRTLAEMGATVTFILALVHMPLANLTAIMQALPLAVTLAAAVFLKESIGWRRLAAICVGFIGVLIIVRPGPNGFEIWSLLGLGSVGFVVVRDLATRFLSREVPSVTVALMAATSVAAMGGLVTVTQGWEPVSSLQWGQALIASVFLVIGYLFAVMVMRVGDISYIAPFRYTALLWAILMGFLFFGNFPDGLTLLGSGLVVASGIFTLWRERRMKKRQLPPRV